MLSSFRETNRIKVDPQQFLEDGFAILREVIPPDQLENLRARFEVLVERQKAVWAGARKPADFDLDDFIASW